MSVHSCRLQFVIGISNFLKTKVKGVFLVKGSWYEMPGSLGLPFDLNQPLMFSSLSQLDGARSFLDRSHFDMPLFFGHCR